jgi:AraC-like DNA-binding protein
MNTKSLIYLWEERTLFLGRLDTPLKLSQGAATLMLSLEGPILVKSDEHKTGFESTCVLLKPGCSVNVDTRHQLVANCYLDVMGKDFSAISTRCSNLGHGIYHQFKNEASFKQALLEIHINAPKPDLTKRTIDALFLTCPQGEFLSDARITKIVSKIKGAIDINLSIEDLAESVSLSVPGLTKLFKKQTGVPIRRYRQWHRLYVTALEISKGKNLTDAAIDAGFVDLSHCTHTFNTMLGMRPSYFLSRPKDIVVMADNKQNLACSVR